MKKARMLGSYAGHLAKQRSISVSHLSQLLSCTETQVQAFFKGRAFPSYNQLSALAKALGTTPKRLIAGDEQSYNETVVHCDGTFSNPDNREKILDTIDDYMGIHNTVHCR